MENKLCQFALNWMDKNFNINNLDISVVTVEPAWVFYNLDGVTVMIRDDKNQRFWFDTYHIWDFFRVVLDMDDDEIKTTLKFWLEDNCGIDGLKPDKVPTSRIDMVMFLRYR